MTLTVLAAVLVRGVAGVLALVDVLVDVLALVGVLVDVLALVGVLVMVVMMMPPHCRTTRYLRCPRPAPTLSCSTPVPMPAPTPPAATKVPKWPPLSLSSRSMAARALEIVPPKRALRPKLK